MPPGAPVFFPYSLFAIPYSLLAYLFAIGT